MYRSFIFASVLLAALPALAQWHASANTALIEDQGHSSLSLTCDNNANTGNHPSWRIEVRATGFQSSNVPTTVNFKFHNRELNFDGENRQGAVAIEQMNEAQPMKIATLLQHLRHDSRVSVSLTDKTNGNPLGTYKYSLKGSRTALSEAAKSCGG